MSQTTDGAVNQVNEATSQQPLLIPTTPMSLTESYGSTDWRHLSQKWEIGMFQTDPRNGKLINLPTTVLSATTNMGVTILVVEDDEPDEHAWARASMQSLAKYWDTPEEDAAWAHL